MDDELFPCEDYVLLARYPTSEKRSMEVITRGDSSFITEEISNLIEETLERVIGTNAYQPQKINRWAADLVDQLLTELTRLDRPFKYIVQAVIVQNIGSGFHAASACFWDNKTDDSCTVRWENKHLYAIVSVFGLSI